MAYRLNQQPIETNARLEPLCQAYMATSHMSHRDAKQQQYVQLFQGMMSRARVWKTSLT